MENNRSTNTNPTKTGDGLICKNNDLQNTKAIPSFSGVHVARSFVLCVVFCRSLFLHMRPSPALVGFVLLDLLFSMTKHYTENKRPSNTNPTKAGDGLICTNNDLQRALVGFVFLDLLFSV
jgi:hypothetical protein